MATVKSDDVGTWGGACVDDEEEVITGKICCCTTSMGEDEEQSIVRYSWSKFKSAHPSDFWIGPFSDAPFVSKKKEKRGKARRLARASRDFTSTGRAFKNGPGQPGRPVCQHYI